MSELEEINNKLTKVCVHVENTEKTITEMKEEREKHKDVFWNNMNAMKDSLRDEQEARKLADLEIKADAGKMKVRLGIYVTIISTAFGVFVAWIRTKW
ncbi:hypothetical protein LCGC14_1114560 [marine sediment metagenome]|uniref:Uncharacterized protein n=1 Tax=marine sediment metagenome TaxID=412755 RepID=A0A0F9M5Q7_9ZZZZ|nr:hypothetical protein [Candidatus Aminicenantes bacterium]